MQLNAFGKGRVLPGLKQNGRGPQFKKLLLMQLKLMPVLLMMALSAWAGGFSQTVNLSVKEMPLVQVISKVKEQTGYLFFYDGSVLKDVKPVTIAARNMPLQAFLEQVLKNQPLNYSIQNTTVILSRKAIKQPPVMLLPEAAPMPPPPDFSGRVADSMGAPLAGASVVIKGSKKGVMTDAYGYFTLKGVEAGTAIVVSFAGYIDKEITPGADDAGFKPSQRVYIVLKRSDNILDELQIIAYGQTSRRLSTGNISTIKAKDIEKAPVTNPLLAIAGRVPGITIIQSTGFAGSGVEVQVQGQSSIGQGTVPFYVVDGIPFVQYTLAPLSGIQGNSGSATYGGYSNPLSYINPQDIESIDVLKDADATAIYGSRAAAGAILITTKKGKAGKTNVSVNVQHGFGEVAKKMDNMNTRQYLAMRKAAYEGQGLAVPGAGTTPGATNYDVTYWDQNRYTDWQKELIGGKAGYSDVQVTASGGNVNTQILLGANYHRETTVMPGDFSYKRGGVHFNMSHSSADQRFKLSFGGNYLTDNNNLPGADLTSYALRTPPNAPALYDAAGALNWAALPSGAETWSNPLRYIVRKYKTNTTSTQGNAELGYRIWSTLTLKSTFGYTNLQTDELTTTPQTYYAPSTVTNSRGTGISDKKVTNWIIEPQLTYQFKTRYGKFDALLGTTFQRNMFNLLAFSASGFSNDGQLENIYAATSVAPTNAIQETYNYNAVFGRLNYNYRDKYIANLTARRDGSSRFGSDNLFHTFYGAGAAWVFSRENWMSELPFVSFGKLRVSYGTTGNDQIGNYAFMSLYSSFAAAVPYGGGSTLRVTRPANPGLQWEETKKFNAGIDLGFFSDRILLNLNYYRNRSSNQLLNYNLPVITGFSSVTRNFPATVQNSGIEFVINTDNIRGKNFKWSTSLNMSIPRNKLVAFPGLATSSFANTLIVGEPLKIVKAFQFAGVNPATGIYNYTRPDKTLIQVPVLYRDETVVIDRTQRFYGGLQNSISYKGFSLDFLLQFVKQKGYDDTRFGYSTPGVLGSAGASGNQPVSILNNTWKKADDVTAYQQLYTGSGIPALVTAYSYASSAYNSDSWSDASFIRVKNLSFSYALPVAVTKAAHLQNAKLYVQGQNLFTITGYKGLDPETQSSLVLPPLRTITFGAQVTF